MTENLAVLRQKFCKIQNSSCGNNPWEPSALFVIITNYNKFYAMAIGWHKSGHISDEKLFLNNPIRFNSVVFSFFLPLDSLIGVWAAWMLKFGDHTQTHRETVWLLWARDRPVSESSTLQYNINKRDIYAVCGIPATHRLKTILIC
jgi:hypothetical protein